MPSKNFSLSSINKDQFKDLQNYLNQKMIAAIDTVDGSTLGDNLITSHQVDYIYVLNAHSSNKVGSITPLV